MRVLLDGNLPRGMVRLLTGHDVETIHQRRWSDLSNGALLHAAEAEYDVFVTLDQSLRFQQNMTDRSIAVVVLRARSNRLTDIEPLIPDILRAVSTT